ncbi:MAG: hypothetical protein KZQ59_15155 [Candidatus Thiodiazotropha sp. (ex Lucinoma aequizonata)]|nr:hypothetical protein [Candidatus Thiodiazotropha sp. (ex Lucinoma aequizonata)]MCU7910226.1 hypothetical protein [Candidatus Thiodiazotropha sp. (ex Lucinoma aequizonata)]
MGNVLNLIGRGGANVLLKRFLGWNRVTIRKGQTELRSGTTFESYFSARGVGGESNNTYLICSMIYVR